MRRAEHPASADADGAYRPGAPLWLRVALLFVLIWLGAHILGNVTDAFMRMAGAGR